MYEVVFGDGMVAEHSEYAERFTCLACEMTLEWGVLLATLDEERLVPGESVNSATGRPKLTVSGLDLN